MITASISPTLQAPAAPPLTNGAGENPLKELEAKINQPDAAPPPPQPAPPDKELAKRMKAIRGLGEEIDEKKREIEQQETKVAAAESKLKGERGDLHQLEHELEELQDELNTLALGKQSERLPFGQKAAAADPKPKAPATASPAPSAAADANAWRAVKLEDLGIAGRTLKALQEHQPPLTTHGELSAWQEKKGDFWAKDIAGVGDKARDEIERTQERYWREHPGQGMSGKVDAAPAPAKAAGGGSAQPLTPADLGLAADVDLEATAHPNLLAALQSNGGFAPLHDAPLAAKDGLLWVNVGPGNSDDVHRLKRVYPADSGPAKAVPAFDGKPASLDADAYAGGRVTWDGKEFVIGSRGLDRLVRAEATAAPAAPATDATAPAGAMPKAKHVQLDDDVAAVLRAQLDYVDTDRVVITGERLDPKLYKRVDEVLGLLGGKWSRKEQCHIFPSPAKAVIDAAIGDGKVLDRKKTFQFFETPADVAKEMVRWAMIDPTSRVLEPSAGRGAIARVIREMHPKAPLTCVELDPDNVLALSDKGHTVIQADFLTWGMMYGESLELIHVEPHYEFDRILMNPPFSGGQDVDHLLHAWDLLRPKGRLVAILPAMTLASGSRQNQRIAELLTHRRAMVDLPPGTFADSGTNVATKLLVLDKPEEEEDAPAAKGAKAKPRAKKSK